MKYFIASIIHNRQFSDTMQMERHWNAIFLYQCILFHHVGIDSCLHDNDERCFKRWIVESQAVHGNWIYSSCHMHWNYGSCSFRELSIVVFVRFVTQNICQTIANICQLFCKQDADAELLERSFQITLF